MSKKRPMATASTKIRYVQKKLKNCKTKIVQPSSSSRKKKHSLEILGSMNYSAGAQKSVHPKDMLNWKLDKVAIPTSHGFSANEVRTDCLQNENKLVVPGTNPFGPFRIKVNLSRKNTKPRGQIQPYNIPNIPGSMKCSRSVSPMSLSSPSPRPAPCPGVWNQ